MLYPMLSFLWILLGACLASATEVNNVTFEQDTVGSKQVTIHYTLVGDTSDVILDISLDGGSSFQQVQQGTSGAIGMDIPPGQNVIQLDLAALGNPATVNAQFRVVALQNFVRVPAGEFMMGQVDMATPEHSVTLTHDFLLGRTEVTNAQYLEALNWAKAQELVSLVGDYVQQYGVNLLRINQSGYDRYEIRYNAGTQQFFLQAGTWDDGYLGPGEAYPGGYDPSTHPVMWVTWYGAACYCDWLSQMNGLPAYYNGNWWQIPSPNNPYAATGYRLPTEAEWEFAAQYDDERFFPWGSTWPNCTLANYYPSSFCVGWTSPVGTLPAGASNLGLQDMAGNVGEWCNDRYGSYSSSAWTNPPGPAGGSDRVIRGGNWCFVSAYLPCAFRQNSTPSTENYRHGFRLCRTLP